MSDTIRAFIAVDLPESIMLWVRQLQDDLKASRMKARWVRPEQIHLTLKFLGDIRVADSDTVGRVIEETAKQHSPISLMVNGLGVFPGVRRPRVLWAGITGQVDQLSRMQNLLEDRLATAGFPRENRAFQCHLTLARFRDPPSPEAVMDAIARSGGFAPRPFVVDAVHLYKSRLDPSGAVYTRLMSAALSG